MWVINFATHILFRLFAFRICPSGDFPDLFRKSYSAFYYYFYTFRFFSTRTLLQGILQLKSSHARLRCYGIFYLLIMSITCTFTTYENLLSSSRRSQLRLIIAKEQVCDILKEIHIRNSFY